MPKTSVDQLLTRGLGFCCPYAGLEANRKISCALLGVRLGVSGRAVRYKYEALAAGEIRCEHNRNCMKERLHARTAKNV
jgi:hypothetical protein